MNDRHLPTETDHDGSEGNETRRSRAALLSFGAVLVAFAVIVGLGFPGTASGQPDWPTSAKRATVGAPKRSATQPRRVSWWTLFPRVTTTVGPSAPAATSTTTTTAPTTTRQAATSPTTTRATTNSVATTTPQPAPTPTAAPTTKPTTTTPTPTGLLYASPTGSGTQCSSAVPCALSFALSGGNGLVSAGKTLRLQAGQYVGCFESKLVGARVEAEPGQRVKLVGNTPSCSVLQINGSDTSYVGLDVSNANTSRQVKVGGAAINVYGPRTKIINCFVHDAENAIGLWSPAVNSEVHGCVAMHAGYASPEAGGEGRGYGLYVQSNSTATVENNHFLMGFSFGVHAYTEGGFLDGLRFQGNSLAQAGVTNWVHGAYAPNFWIGGYDLADGLQLINNLSFHAPSGLNGGGNKLDYGLGFGGATITGNYFAGPNIAVEFGGGNRNSSISGNQILGPVQTQDSNAYPDNQFLGCCPSTGTKISLRANKYQAGRSELSIVNWAKAASVGVAMPAGTYEIRSAFDYWGKAVTVVSNGTLQVPMTGWTVQAPNGAPTPANPQPVFGDFIVQKI